MTRKRIKHVVMVEMSLGQDADGWLFGQGCQRFIDTRKTPVHDKMFLNMIDWKDGKRYQLYGFYEADLAMRFKLTWGGT